MSKGYYWFLIIFLGILTAFGPFVTDMCLPTLPAMADVFKTTASAVQMGLTTSMLGLAIGQLIFGPLSDKYGRKKVLLYALFLFAFSTVACIFSTTIEMLNIGRFVQGLGAAGGIVLSRSISTDSFTGRELAKAFVIIGAVNGVAPVSAPVIGGLVATSIGWKGIFWVLFGLGVILLTMCSVYNETLPVEKRSRGSLLSLMSSFPKLLRIKYYVIYVLISGFANGILFAYISSASFIIQNHYHYSELFFSIIFGINAVGIGVGSALTLKFKNMINAAFSGACGCTALSLLQFVNYYAFGGNFYVFETMIFFTVLCLGFILSSSTTLAMEEGRAYTGSASALFGAVGFTFGALVSPLVGLGNIMTSTFATLTVTSLVALFLSFVASRRHLQHN